MIGKTISHYELTLNPSLKKRGTFAPLLLLREGGGEFERQSMNRHIIQTAKQACRELRKKSTSSERLLWQAVRNRKVLGKKFYRQYPIMFKYMDKERFLIADFFCYKSRLVIEIDGKKHDDQKDYDELRTHIINNLGIEVVRFKNDEIDNDLNGVLRRLQGLLSGETYPKSLS